MGAAGEMISDMDDMQRWVNLYVTGKTNGVATQQARLKCIPIGHGNLSFGLGIGCSAGWYGYTGGLPGYNTAGYYFPAEHVTIIAWVTLQADKPAPGVANAIFRDIARIMTPRARALRRRNTVEERGDLSFATVTPRRDRRTGSLKEPVSEWCRNVRGGWNRDGPLAEAVMGTGHPMMRQVD